MSQSILPSIYDLYAEYPHVWEIVNSKRVGKEVRCTQNILNEYAQGNRLLDLGCGTGHHAARLAEQGFQVVGCDINETAISIAEQRHESTERLSFVVGDMRSLNYEPSFHAVICMQSVFSYNLTTEDIVSSLEGIRRCLLPRGLLIIDVFHILALFKYDRFMQKRELMFTNNGISIFLETVHRIDEEMQTMISDRKWWGDFSEHIYLDHSVSRLFFRQELAALLKLTGYKVVDLSTTLSLTCREQMPDRLTVIAKKNA